MLTFSTKSPAPKPSASLRPSAFALKALRIDLSVSAVQCDCVLKIFVPLPSCVMFFVFTFSADCSLPFAAATPQMAGGGYTRATRGIGVISAMPAESPASHLCRFSALLPCSRLPFRRPKGVLWAEELHNVQFVNQKG